MQAVVAIPDPGALRQFGNSAEQVLLRKVAGVPLLTRIAATASSAGLDSLLVIWPLEIDSTIWDSCFASPLLKPLKTTRLFWRGTFNPQGTADWRVIAESLEDRFYWLPWNWVTDRQGLATLVHVTIRPCCWQTPTLLAKTAVTNSQRSRLVLGVHEPNGVAINSDAEVATAESLLLARSGKSTEEVYSIISSGLCRPVVRLLCHTRFKAEILTLGSLAVAVMSSIMFARGTYSSCLTGALLFFISGLFDETNSMLALITLRNSVFWHRSKEVVENLTWAFVAGGVTTGLYRQFGPREVVWGGVLTIGCMVSAIIIAIQRRAATPTDCTQEQGFPSAELSKRAFSISFSSVVGLIRIFNRKRVAIHYLLIFSISDGLPLFLRLAALAGNLSWLIALYLNLRISREPITAMDVESTSIAA